MPAEAQLAIAFALAVGVAYAATPRAMALAARTDFHDAPTGYKGHAQPTPYLGGVAVLAGFLIASVMLGGDFARLSPIVAIALCLWVLGTVDDRFNLSPWLRVGVEAGGALLLWASGLGFDLFGPDALNIAVTVLWVVGITNAFNLMDNMDGAAATIGAVTGAAVAVLALIEGDVALATLMFGLAGACLGFLPYNLSSPARIFLGDGGSLPIGFVLAAAIMALPIDGDGGLPPLLAAALLAGLPVLDTALVFISRWRAGVPLLSGGRDHLTHRLLTRLATPRAVAVTLGLIQVLLASVAIAVTQSGEASIVTAWTVWFVAGAGVVGLLETRTWTPDRSWMAPPASSDPAESVAPRRAPSPVEAGLIVFIAAACGLSPFFYGFYDLSVWGPIALVLLAALVGLVIARPSLPRPGALVAAGALGLVWVWALLSTSWAESADQAMTGANRWLLYAALFGVLVLLVRDDRLGALVVGAGAAVILGLGGYIAVRMLAGTASSLFPSGRLDQPLGYINGQAGYLLLGVWPLVAVAERARRPWLAGPALGGATFLGALAVLSQTRAIVPALVISALVLLVLVPGRLRRAWCLVLVVAGVAATLPWVLDVYSSTRVLELPGQGVLRHAVVAIVLASAAVGAVWGVAVWAVEKAPARQRWAAGAGLAAVVLVAVVAGLSAVHDPAGKVRSQYDAFVHLRSNADTSSRFASGGGNRYDYWRIAWHQFRDRPWRGVGSGNFDRTYFLERRTTEDVRNAHSIWLQSLGELGLPGGLLVLAFAAAVLAGLARRARAGRREPLSGALAVAAGGTFLVWLLHTSVDWLHLIPGLTGIALCSAAVLVGPWRSGAGPARSRVRLAASVGVAVLAVLGAVTVGRSTLAEHYRSEARDALPAHPAAAIDHARDSLDLNDEALPTYFVLASAQARAGRYGPARAALTEAIRREPHDFVPWALRGDLAVRRGELASARSDYAAASRLNPRDRALRALAADPRQPAR